MMNTFCTCKWWQYLPFFTPCACCLDRIARYVPPPEPTPRIDDPERELLDDLATIAVGVVVGKAVSSLFDDNGSGSTEGDSSSPPDIEGGGGGFGGGGASGEW
jgi:uncharacterized membrane protein YgcG